VAPVRDIAVFSGTAHPALAAEICGHLGVPLFPTRVTRFANDCLEVQLEENCRERDVFLIQPLVAPVQEHLVELLLMLDAARGASAARTTVVLPYYAYARSDKKDMPRISIGGRLVADLLVTAGANRVLAMTLHSPQVHGFFSIPVDHLHALREIAGHFAGQDLSTTTVVSPDLGNAKSAAAFARRLGVPVAAGAKQRMSDDRVEISTIIGDVTAPAASASPAPTGSSPTTPSTGWPRGTTSSRSSARTPCPSRRTKATASSRCSPWRRPWPRRCAASTTASPSAPCSVRA
jgi:ribose-phosphate pyrophosphokinase